MRSGPALTFAIAMTLAIGAHPAPARADPAAEALFREGRELILAGKISEACDKFQRSEDLEAKVGTLLNLGDCREQEGQLADAWDAFTQAQALATRSGDDRVALATDRAAALEPRLAHLTIKVTAHVPGLAITRNGRPVAEAVWDTEIPVDPGPNDIAATAPGYKPRATSVELAVGAHGAATVPALEVDPFAARANGPPGAESFVVTPPLARVGFGLAIGGTSDSDIVVGVRVVGGYAVPRGAVRATLQGLWTRENDDDPYHHIDLYAIGLGFDYLLAWGRGLASALGVGAGIDITDDNYDGVSRDTWTTVRASPLVIRLASPKLEIGLHLQLVFPAKVVVGVLAVDWFVW